MPPADRPFPQGATLNELFEAAVLANPESIALEGLESSLSYSELQQWANCIASVVVDNGVARGDRVFILIDDTLLSAAVVLGLGKAAAVGVRPNPGDPPEVGRLILEDSGARLILATDQNLELANSLAGGNVHAVFLDPGQFDEQPLIRNRTGPEDRVWIAYTSGSTGRPKGVTHTERSAMSFLASYITSTELCISDRVARLHETREMDMLSALIVGASSYEFNLGRTGFAGIGRWLSERRITILPTVPTVFRYILKDLQLQPVDLVVRLLRLSGEPPAQADLLQAATVFPESCRILNWYGSTEVAVASRTYSFADLARIPRIPAGRIFDEIEVEIIDDHGTVVGGSQLGEISVSGNALFEGYWNRPDLNAVAFSEASDGSGRRRFSTGDAGFIDAAGELNICGRKDEQIKVFGFRVEPGEIGAALRAIPGISDAAVVAVKGKLRKDATTELAAYLLFEGHIPPTADALRKHLGEVLPRYKVPVYFVQIGAFPKLSSGKTDKRSLPAFVPESRLDYNTVAESGRP